ncbi:MAG: hypothetical protein ABI651_20090 [Verrucomicrobiota bacterium]
MDRIAKTLILALSGLALTGTSAVVSGDTPENPYRVIAERNAFDLKPYQEPPAPKVPEAPVADLKLSGFTRIGNIKRVFLVGMNPKEPGRLIYYEMEERVSQDGIEVLEIDELNGKAKIRRGGADLELSYEKNGMSPTKTPAAAPAQPNSVHGAAGVTRPGMPGNPNQPYSGPVIVGKNHPAANPSSPYFQPASSTANLAAQAAANPVDTSRSGLRQIPTRQVRTAPPLQTSNLSAEEQVILMEAQRMKAAQQGMALPPTPGLPSLPGGAPGIPSP